MMARMVNMDASLLTGRLTALIPNEQAINAVLRELNAARTSKHVWPLVANCLRGLALPFETQLEIFKSIFPNWQTHPEHAPAWLPSQTELLHSNIAQVMTAANKQDIAAFQQWSATDYEAFWTLMIRTLNIQFTQPFERICDLSQGVENPHWLPQAKLNIAASCFNAPADFTAILYDDAAHKPCRMSYGELNQLSNRVANSLIAQGYQAGDAIAVAMPMNHYAIAIYLGIIKMGGAVVSIADSFSSQEMATRFTIAKVKAVFTQDALQWAGKRLPLYDKVMQANAACAIVLPCEPVTTSLSLRAQDVSWEQFLIDNDQFTPLPCDPLAPANILFSSGTTGEPKAIVWNHTTPIKAASDAYLHQNIKPQDVLAWPTNLGWMMGPWLVFATLINHATMALYPEAPKDRAFGEFIIRHNVTMLGVVPTLVATWRQSACMEGLDFHTIKVFSSTGECSNPEDMLYLMSLAGYKPVIEYCGGTEIGGAYVSSTVIQANCPSLFSTPAMGSAFTIINEDGKPADVGEVALIPPALGLSTQLLNADHFHVYYEDMPHIDNHVLRRHSDQIKRYPGNYYAILGRVDDTMNLGGIKTSAVEIERSLVGIDEIKETAAIAITPPNNGPSLLVIYAATSNLNLDKTTLKKAMQQRINKSLNPLFKIHEVMLVSDLPKTASNKIMRRLLRKNYGD